MFILFIMAFFSRLLKELRSWVLLTGFSSISNGIYGTDVVRTALISVRKCYSIIVFCQLSIVSHPMPGSDLLSRKEDRAWIPYL